MRLSVDGARLPDKYRRLPAHLYPDIKRGEASKNSKLVDDDIRAIREYGKSKGLKEIASIFMVSTATISNILRGKTWKHVQ